MKTYKLILIFLFISSLVFSKSILDKGDQLYADGNYYAAMEIYKAYTPKENEKLELKLKMARCYFNLNKMKEAYRTFYDIKDSLTGDDIYMYATALNKIGNYKEAMKWYYNIPKEDAERLNVKEKIMSCRWAIQTKKTNPLELNPTRLADLGQSFGIQYYKKGVVYSYPDENKYKKDNHGMSFQNLFYSDLNTNQIAQGQKKFSSNLVFPYHIGAITFSHNYTRIYYTKTVQLKRNKSVLKIFTASYDPGTNDWINESELTINSDNYNCAHPAVSPDNKYLYYTSDKDGGFGGKDIYRVEIKENYFGEPENLGRAINTPDDEMFPFVSTDNTLYFSSNGHDGYGGLDVFKSNLSNGQWQRAENLLIPVNSSFDDFAYIIDPNNKNNGFVSSDRENSTDVIYAFSKIEKAPLKLASVVENSTEGYPVENSKVTLSDSGTKEEIGSAYTDKYGAFEIPIPEKYRDNSQQLEIEVTQAQYEDKKITIPAKRILDVNNRRIPIELINQKFPNTFDATIVDIYNGNAIGSMQVVLKDAKSNKVIGESVSNEEGKIDIQIPNSYRNSNQNFNIEVPESEGYDEQKMTVSINELDIINKKGLELKSSKKDLPVIFSSKIEMEDNQVPIQDAVVSLTDTKTGKTIGQAKTNKDGSFNIPIPTKYRNTTSIFKVTTKSIPGLLIEDMTISITDLNKVADKGFVAKTYNPNDGLAISSIVKNKKTGKPIANAQVKIKDKITGDIIGRSTTNINGKFNAVIPKQYETEKRAIEIETVSVPGYFDTSEAIAIDDVAKLDQGLALQPKDNYSIKISSKLTTTYNGEPIVNADINIKDAITGESLGETKSKEDGYFEIYISDIYKGPKEFIVEIKKGKQFTPKKIVSTIEDLDNMRRDGIAMTPIFNDEMLDEINTMVIPHNRRAITSRGYAVLDKLAFFMKENPNIVIKLNGQTDIRGERTVNLSLSQEMADTAKKYLMNKGVASSNIIARGYGDRYVINKCKRGVACSLTEHEINNRVEVIVWKKLRD